MRRSQEVAKCAGYGCSASDGADGLNMVRAPTARWLRALSSDRSHPGSPKDKGKAFDTLYLHGFFRFASVACAFV
jgi:hypothetical protein